MKRAAGNRSEDIAFAVIGGSGFSHFPELETANTVNLETPFGVVVAVTVGELAGKKIAFLPRHGPGHALPPHRINYRANVWALKYLGINRVIAINAVGGIRSDMHPGGLVVPDQIIDYTYAREQTFFDGAAPEVVSDNNSNLVFSKDSRSTVRHIDFTHPYDLSWRAELINHLRDIDVPFIDSAVYACTQGPRLESAAEVARLQRDGADIVGMTGMPEAALARELEIAYASLGVVVNWAAGISEDLITMDAIMLVMDTAMANVKDAIRHIAAAGNNESHPLSINVNE